MMGKNSNQYDKNYYEANKIKLRKRKTELMRKYRAENPEKYRKYWRDRKRKQRQDLLNMYGNQCSVCGFENPIALTLDHVKNNGNEERKRLSDYQIYKRALEKYRPKEYRTLCMNCQFIERQKVNEIKNIPKVDRFGFSCDSDFNDGFYKRS